jgi:hypothetical protein
MSKMKELFMQLEEERESFESHYGDLEVLSDVKCINCNQYKLEKVAENAYECLYCGINITEVEDRLIIEG